MCVWKTHIRVHVYVICLCFVFPATTRESLKKILVWFLTATIKYRILVCRVFAASFLINARMKWVDFRVNTPPRRPLHNYVHICVPASARKRILGLELEFRIGYELGSELCRWTDERNKLGLFCLLHTRWKYKLKRLRAGDGRRERDEAARI